MKLKRIIGFCLSMLIVGCGDMKTNNPTARMGVPDAYSWLNGADVVEDVRTHIEKGDYRLIAVANRGKTIVGLTASDDKAFLESACGVRFLSGLGDTIGSELEKAWRDKALEYAKAFNEKMKVHCTEK